MFDALKEVLQQKKGVAWIVTGIVIVGNAILRKVAADYAMDPSAVYQFVIATSAYTVGQGVADHGKGAAEVNAKAQAAAAAVLAALPNPPSAITDAAPPAAG